MMAAAQQVDDTYASAGTSEHFEDDDVLNSLPPNSQRHRPDGGEHRETFLPSDSVVVDGINHGCVDGLVDSDDEADAGADHGDDDGDGEEELTDDDFDEEHDAALAELLAGSDDGEAQS